MYTTATIDTTRFPAGAVFTFNVSGREYVASSHCFRLAEVVTDNQFDPVPSSEVCTSAPPNFFALQSGPLALSSGNHIYMLQWKQVSGGDSAWLGTVRVLADWQEYSPAVGGTALLPDIGDSSPSNYITLAALVGLAVVALSGGARYARRRWLG